MFGAVGFKGAGVGRRELGGWRRGNEAEDGGWRIEDGVVVACKN